MENSPVYNKRPKSIWVGVIIIAIGLSILLRRMGVDIPDWIFSWEMFLIAIGVFVGFRRGFRDNVSWVLILVGLLFLARREGWIPFEIRHFIWPVLIIIIGLIIMIRPKRRYNWGGNWQSGNENVNDDIVDSVAIFWGSRRNIFSKNFKGGEIVNIFGGTEINLNQADINGTATLDIVAIFGGVKLIVPPGWDVRINVVHIFAGTDDKRGVVAPSDGKKVLVLTGTAIFGGIDVRSY